MKHASTLHPTVLAKVGKETVRVMFDSGVGSSHLCTDIITKRNLKPARKERRCMEKMLGSMRRTVDAYNITIDSFAIEGSSIEVDAEMLIRAY